MGLYLPSILLFWHQQSHTVLITVQLHFFFPKIFDYSSSWYFHMHFRNSILISSTTKICWGFYCDYTRSLDQFEGGIAVFTRFGSSHPWVWYIALHWLRSLIPLAPLCGVSVRVSQTSFVRFLPEEVIFLMLWQMAFEKFKFPIVHCCYIEIELIFIFREVLGLQQM